MRWTYSSQCAIFHVSRSDLRFIMRALQTATSVTIQMAHSFAPYRLSFSLRAFMYAGSRISRENGALISTVSA